MKNIFLIFLIFFSVVASVSAQEEFYTPTKTDEAFREYRSRQTVPPYGLQKIKQLVSKTTQKSAEYGDGGIQAIEPGVYKNLSLREKFTYTMIHPEMNSQNCAIFIPTPNEDKKIFAHFISWTSESEWSDRQLTFLRENRDSVMAFIKESTSRSGHMGVNYKDAIEIINGWEMIPFVIEYFNKNKKDKDALTLLHLLMKKGEYEPFIKSQSYKSLYGRDYNYESYINYNSANEKLVIERANGYYDEKKK